MNTIIVRSCYEFQHMLVEWKLPHSPAETHIPSRGLDGFSDSAINLYSF